MTRDYAPNKLQASLRSITLSSPENFLLLFFMVGMKICQSGEEMTKESKKKKLNGKPEIREINFNIMPQSSSVNL
jgi:hypothetical protein